MKINKWKQKFWNIWNTIKQINKKCMQLFKAKERFNLKFQITLWKKSILTKNLNYVMKINIYIYIYKKIRIKKLRLVGNGKVCLDNLKNKAFTKKIWVEELMNSLLARYLTKSEHCQVREPSFETDRLYFYTCINFILVKFDVFDGFLGSCRFFRDF